jgi:hypothetical protein
VANGRRRRRFFAWWSMEGEGEGFLLGGQWKEKEKVPLLGGQWKEKEKVLLLGGQWKEKEKVPFYPFPLSPQTTLLKPSLFIL